MFWLLFTISIIVKAFTNLVGSVPGGSVCFAAFGCQWKKIEIFCTFFEKKFWRVESAIFSSLVIFVLLLLVLFVCVVFFLCCWRFSDWCDFEKLSLKIGMFLCDCEGFRLLFLNIIGCTFVDRKDKGKEHLIYIVMKIKVSRVFAKFINEIARESGKEFFAQVAKMNANAYQWVAGDPYEAESYGDYDITTGKLSVICVSYPANYYANNRYISTKELTNEFRRRGVKDVAGLKSMIIDLFEI